MSANKIVVPANLDRLLTPALRLLIQQLPFWRWFGIGIAILIMYGPVVGRHIDHNGWRYLILPLIGPPLTALYYNFKPPNPYARSSARMEGLEGYDRKDAKAAQLVTIFRSRAARVATWRAALNISMIEFAAMAILLLGCLVNADVQWTFSSYWLWQGFIGCCLGSFIAVSSDLFAWVLRTWIESAHT
ncbi:MAG TPA: hypothetical protein VFI23_10100 [Rhizomicrobium sp.]|nr:hypothetical protein [Rhizomicrobium sp.]